jgi:hypothetical protein
MQLSFPPVANWADFEELTNEVAKYKLNGSFDIYGRGGQAQYGIDILGYDKDFNSIGIQCKHKKFSKAGKELGLTSEITIDIIKKELENIKKLEELKESGKSDYGFEFYRYVLATTSFRDTKIQNELDKLNRERIKTKKFPIEIWFWETFDVELNKHSDLMYFFYKNFLEGQGLYNKDKHILSLLRFALDRPAFSTPFNYENNCEHFINAISDTQSTIKTGILKDRDGNVLRNSYSINAVSDVEIKDELVAIQELLRKIRNYVTKNLQEEKIIQGDSFLMIRDDNVIKYLNSKRIKIINHFNEAAKKHPKISQLKPKLIE